MKKILFGMMILLVLGFEARRMVPEKRNNDHQPKKEVMATSGEVDCLKVSVLMYHHIEKTAEAKKNNQTRLSVSPEFFEKHLAYLKSHGYEVIDPHQLEDAWNGKTKLSEKTVMITLDDAYEDNYIYAFPLLKKYGYRATIFVPTGLVGMNNYLTWDEIREMSQSGLVYFGNHTWSHHGSVGPRDEIKREISIADSQLQEKLLNLSKVFAYPYGKPSDAAEEILSEMKYSMAFTTAHGDILCKKDYLRLPRIRAGNAQLSSYGL